MKFKYKRILSIFLTILLLPTGMSNTVQLFAEEETTSVVNENSESPLETEIAEEEKSIEETVQPEEEVSSENNEETATQEITNEVSEQVEEVTETIKPFAASLYVAPVTLPAPINQAFPTPVIASAVAQAVYSNSSAVGNNVTQAQLNSIAGMSIGNFSGTLDLSELTAYGGFNNLQTFTISSYGTASFPDNFNTTQFPKMKTMTLNNLANTSLPDFQLATLDSLRTSSLHSLVGFPDFSGLPALTILAADYGTSFVSVPDFSNLPNLKNLTLTSLSNLKVIPDFQYLPLLTSLNTQYTFLSEAINFSHLPNLTNMSHSSEGELPDYDKLPKLTSLSIMGGTFTRVPDFQYLPLLNYTYLWTGAKTLEIPDFSNLPQMKTMTIRGLNDGTTTSPTNTVPDFSGMPLMNNLTITGYAITSVPNFAFMPVITSLSVNLTKIGAVPDFDQMPIMKTLSLSQNLLTSVPNFQHMPVLDRLTISNTLITQLPDFNNFSNLTALYINNNKLTTIPNWNMPKLQTLYATNNMMTVIPTFDMMQSVQTLTLSYNRLDTIPNLSLPNLTALSIDNNYITVLPAMNLLPKMTTFNVATNRLAELPTRVLTFSVSNLLPQSPIITKTVEAGTDFTTNVPIIDQVAPKMPGFAVRNSYIDGKTVPIGPASSAMLVPTNTLKPGNHTANIYMGPSASSIMVSVNYVLKVVDTTPPVITANTEVTYGAGSALPSQSTFLTDVNASALDAIDGIVPVTVDLSGVQMNVIGNYTVTLHASDTSGNQATKEVVVHIVDTAPPVITADTEITYEVGSLLPSESTFLTDVNASALDTIDGIVPVTVDLSGVQMNVVGNYTVTLRASDASGNEGTKEVVVHIEDTTAPVITADTEITYEAGSPLPSESTFLTDVNASALDAIDGIVPVTVDLSGVQMNVVGNYTVILRASDTTGNEATKEVVVHIEDTTAPVITADAEITYEAGSPLPSESTFLTDVNASALDAIDGIVPVTVDLSGIQINVVGNYTVTLRANDMSGNETTKAVVVHIEDTTPPVITADTEITYAAGSVLPSESAFLLEVNASALDTIDGIVPVTVDLSGVQMNVVGDYTVTLRASDAAGNEATQAVVIHIEDTTLPVITADAEITYEAGSLLPSESTFLTDVNASALDATNGNIPVTVDLSGVQMNVVGNYTVTLRASDTSGNEATKEVIVHVIDTTSPVITADPEITYGAGSSLPSESTFLTDVNASAVDSIDGVVTVTVDLSGVQMNSVGNYTVTLRASDASENEATKEVIVHIVDTTPPTITSNTEMTYEVGSSLPSEATFLSDVNASAIDIIDGIVPVTVDLSGVQMNRVGNYIVTLKASDVSGNEATKEVIVHIIDKAFPVITADAEITYEIGTVKTETDFLTDVHAATNDGSIITSDFSTVVDMNKQGDYLVTLSTKSSGINSTFSLENKETGSVTQVIVHIVKNNEAEQLPKTGMYDQELLVIGILTLLFSGVILQIQRKWKRIKR